MVPQLETFHPMFQFSRRLVRLFLAITSFVVAYTLLDNLASSLVRGRAIFPSSDSESCFELVSIWMRRCLTEHNLCPSSSEASLPTRVIDVGLPQSNEEPYLLVTGGRHGQWVTLSHCWGTTIIPKRTTKSNLEQHRQGLPMSELPLTFRDAVTITRRLGYRYLWIGSLSIIQDSPEDWLFESARMGNVYGNAILNIAVEASRNCNDGIFKLVNGTRRVESIPLEIPCVSPSRNIRGSMFVRQRLWGDRFSRGPLSERAWVLQEEVLSPRVLRYSSEQLTWTCSSIHCNEGYPAHHRDNEARGLKEIFNIPRISKNRDGDPGETKNQEDIMSLNMLHRWWYGVVNDFCYRKVTFISDKFQAISALAREVQSRAGYQYKAGIWEEDVLRGLIWSADGMGEPTSTYIAPSWSWTSLDLTKCWGFDFRVFPYDETHYLDFTRIAEECSIKEVHIDYHDNDQFGRVASGYLIISGYWRGIGSWSNVPERFFNGRSEGSWVHKRNIHVKERINMGIHGLVPTALPGQIVCSLDCIPSVEGVGPNLSEREVIYFKIARLLDKRSGDDYAGVLYALLLEQVEGESEVFRRIGIAQIPDDDGMTEGWPARTIKII